MLKMLVCGKDWQPTAPGNGGHKGIDCRKSDPLGTERIEAFSGGDEVGARDLSEAHLREKRGDPFAFGRTNSRG